MYDLYLVFEGKNIYFDEKHKSECFAISLLQDRNTPGAVIRRWWDGQLDVICARYITENDAKQMYYKNFGGI